MISVGTWLARAPRAPLRVMRAYYAALDKLLVEVVLSEARGRKVPIPQRKALTDSLTQEEELRRWAAEVLADTTVAWGRVFGRPLETAGPGLAREVSPWVRENVDLITRLTADARERVRRTIEEGVRAGTSPRDLARAVQEDLQVSRSRARLIARDQILKIHGRATEVSHRAAGIGKFKWVTALDERVRERHARLHGKIFSWDDLPVGQGGRRIRPGEEFQCRCLAAPWDEDIASLPPGDADPHEGPAAQRLAEDLAALDRGEPVPHRIWWRNPRPSDNAPDPTAPPAPGIVNGVPVLEAATAPPEMPPVTAYVPPPAAQWLPRRPLPLPPSDAPARAARLRRSRPTGDRVDVQTPDARAAATAEAERASSALWSTMPPDARTAVERYTWGSDSTIRAYQRGAVLTALVAARYAATADDFVDDAERMYAARVHALEAIQAAHNLERAFFLAREDAATRLPTLYRGVGGLSDAALDAYLSSDVFDFEGATTSASASAGVANRFMMAAIAGRGDAPPGHGVFLVLRRRTLGIPVAAVSAVPSEAEYLLHGNAQWRIVRRVRHTNVQGFQRWLIEAEEI